jgi:nucleotide sugar dehydrogenase
LEEKKIIDISKLILNEESTIDELFQVLSISINPNYGSGFAIVVNSLGELVGIVQDSDIRKYLAVSTSSRIEIKDVMRKDFISVEFGLNQDEIINSIIDQMNNRGKWGTSLPVRVIPVTKKKIPFGILDLVELKDHFLARNTQHVIMGLGYVGLTLALSLAQVGKNVFGYEIDKSKVDSLKNGISYIHEPGIEALLKAKLNKNFFVEDNFTFLSQDFGIQRVFYICVSTPLNKDKSINMDYIDVVISNIMKFIKPLDTIVMRSTVPVGTGRKIIEFICKKLDWNVGTDFHYISAPERTVEGDALREIRDIPQLVSGATSSCRTIGSRIFQEVSSSVIHLEDTESTELIKLMGNAFRDYMFGFSNHLIEIAKKYELDINALIKASNFGYARSFIPLPSPGVGGPCLTKDSYFMYDLESELDKSPIIGARRVNEQVIEKAIDFISSKFESLKCFDCLVIGAAFKGIPETNDIRNSPSLEFISLLDKKVRSILVWDSTLSPEKLKTLGKGASKDINMIAILNNNAKNLEYFFQFYKNLMKKEIIIFDPWKLIDPQQIIFEKPFINAHYFTLSKYEQLKN